MILTPYALKSDGTLWAWGNNHLGTLGDGTAIDRTNPVQISSHTNWAEVSAGALHTLGISSDGTLWSWGLNDKGQLGDGDFRGDDQYSPTKITMDTNWLTVSAGGFHSLAVKTDGTLWAWGDNQEGQIGMGSIRPYRPPIKIGFDANWVTVSAGKKHSLAKKSNGTLWTWGCNLDGQLGDGTTTNKNTPVRINSTIDWLNATAANNSTFAIISNGTLWSWGDNYHGKLGDGTETDRHTPVQFRLPLLLLYFPHIASNATWETEIGIINTSRYRNLTGWIQAYDDSGGFIYSRGVDLQPNGRKSFIVGRNFFNSSNIGYIIFESSTMEASTSVYGYTKFHVAGKYRVAIPATSRINTGDIYVSHIASNDKWWTGISLLNTTSFDKTLTIEFDNSISKTISLDANDHKAFSIKSLFSGVSQDRIKSAVIKNSSGVIGLELFGINTDVGMNYLSGILLRDATAKDIYYPHVALDSEWWTGIVVYNPAATPTDLTINPYKDDGTQLTSNTITLQGKEKYMGSLVDLNLPEGTGWLHVSADKPVTGFELFGKNNGNQLAGYTGVKIKSKTGSFPKLDENGWTGIALVNTENSVAILYIKAFNDTGLLIANKLEVLDAHEKISVSAESLFTKSISNATHIIYTSNNNIVGFQMNGSDDGMLLDALPGNL